MWESWYQSQDRGIFQQHLNHRWRRPCKMLNHDRDLLREENIFVYVDRSIYTCCRSSVITFRGVGGMSIFLHLLRFPVWVTTPSYMGWNSTLLASIVSSDASRVRTFDHRLTLNCSAFGHPSLRKPKSTVQSLLCRWLSLAVPKPNPGVPIFNESFGFMEGFSFCVVSFK